MATVGKRIVVVAGSADFCQEIQGATTIFNDIWILDGGVCERAMSVSE
jgi:hypothetical protein